MNDLAAQLHKDSNIIAARHSWRFLRSVCGASHPPKRLGDNGI